MSNRALKALITAGVFAAPLTLVPTAIAGEDGARAAASCTDADAGDNRHPSGKDRSCETGSLGRSQSDPDGMTNGGADKPGGAGGVDRSDQDFNNGCGNDDDFEDDNNGNCGGRNAAATASTAGADTSRAAPPAAIAGARTTTSVRVAGRAVAEAAPQVLAERLVRPATSALATTGSIALTLLAIAAGALTLGGALRNAGRPRY